MESAVQQDLHHINIAIISSIYQRCATACIIFGAGATGAVDQVLYNVRVSGFNSLNQITAGL
jgi:hypothetical protein